MTAPDHAALCERLNSHMGKADMQEVLRDCREAAAAIERLAAENAAMREALEEIAGIEPKPFEGGLDMEAIRACDECKRYEGHPIQHGICDTHRRPIRDREKHESHEEKALGYRAKTIARTALQGASDDR